MMKDYSALAYLIAVVSAFFGFYGTKMASNYRIANERMVNAYGSLKKLSQDIEMKDRKSKDDILKKEQELDYKAEVLKKLFEEKKIGFPWIASVYADALYKLDSDLAQYLQYKSHPAKKAAEQVQEIANEKRKLMKCLKVASYQLQYYEYLFPWLVEFKEIPDENIVAVKDSVVSTEDQIAHWLTPAEFKNLSDSEKHQLALDRYVNRVKTNWEIGREYERYIGYLYEMKGYVVEYYGAIKGFKDMGRDLVAINGSETIIVQCKYWAKNKTIHEKHVFQLLGTSLEYMLDKGISLNDYLGTSVNKRRVKPLFITSISLSERAKKIAEALGVEVVENVPLDDFPRIKCNISKSSGERIYHLPFDQQYDRIVIEPKKGEMYVATVAAAEALGFRRAYRWKGDVCIGQFVSL